MNMPGHQLVDLAAYRLNDLAVVGLQIDTTGRYRAVGVGLAYGQQFKCRVPDGYVAKKSYPLFQARELLQTLLQETRA